MPKVRGNNSQARRLAIAIMAAGKGTRLKSKHPKVLHEVGGKPLLAHVIAAATQVVPAQDVFVIVGHQADQVRQAVASSGAKFVEQKPQKGTGHALMVARDSLSGYDQVIVLSGDAPLITPATITRLGDSHFSNKAAMTILTACLQDPSGYGRVVRKSSRSDEVQAIVEDKATTSAQKKIHEINSGIYAFAVEPLFRHIDKLGADNAHAEFYLTDMAAILRKAKERVVALVADDANGVLGGNTRADLVEIDRHIRFARCQQLMQDGVTIFYPETCVIDADVEIGEDSVIEPFVQILGSSRIGSDCRIRSYSVIRNTLIDDGVMVLPGCVMDDSHVEKNAVIGPYSRLRPGSEIGEGAHVGNFVETKKTRLGKGSKANHLSYLGDAEIGEGVNVGAGTITCNYDGAHKHATVIEDGVFVGSDTTLVAPLRVAKGAYIGAGSCITDDVPEDSLAIGRARQIVKAGWVKQKREARAKAGKT
ncbi:MAG TPA: bifunctional UDP-N-acetylglucosamine diphosphorylase/glucosamine-1-phosphate N-acetyltransferase GlmU [Terriglobales bacterium]|jgi:bifunctional UDP-N-acetylglucosamine pyrophosphorylase/glucosamine-1-phosphate N-acetyltransferase|nr:bifunctional UDP-N-acetylglucosamine diphosphorylase/glucosamine-1-phosphate N-acetyltransferase GlmU [Terriglobales bacterium]